LALRVLVVVSSSGAVPTVRIRVGSIIVVTIKSWFGRWRRRNINRRRHAPIMDNPDPKTLHVNKEHHEIGELNRSSAAYSHEDRAIRISKRFFIHCKGPPQLPGAHK
jgi:hypothetical protein